MGYIKSKLQNAAGHFNSPKFFLPNFLKFLFAKLFTANVFTTYIVI